jgi:hypothetical protein
MKKKLVSDMTIADLEALFAKQLTESAKALLALPEPLRRKLLDSSPIKAELEAEMAKFDCGHDQQAWWNQ